MLKTAIASFALVLALGAGQAAFAQNCMPGGQVVRGVINHPQFGQVVYLYNRATGYVYFPALNSGGYLNANRLAPSYAYGNPAYGSYRPNNGLWQQNGAVGQNYGSYGSAYRNFNLGLGRISYPGMTAEDIIGSFTR